MNKQTPSVGRILHYVISDDDAAEIVRLRNVSHSVAVQMARGAVAAGDHLPLIVVEYDPGDTYCVAGQVVLKGVDTYYVRSRNEGTTPGTWHWPEREV